MLSFTNLNALAYAYNIPVTDYEELNEAGYKQKTKDQEIEASQAEKYYTFGIDQAIKMHYSPLLQQGLSFAREKLSYSDWIDSRKNSWSCSAKSIETCGSIPKFADQGTIKIKIPSNCGYVQAAYRSEVDGRWQVIFDRELVEKKFSAFMISMLRFHEESYLLGFLLGTQQTQNHFLTSENVRRLTQLVYSGAFHTVTLDSGFHETQDYCSKYKNFHRILRDLHFVEGLENFVSKEGSTPLPMSIKNSDHICKARGSLN